MSHPPPSPLELLHPAGEVKRVVRIGSEEVGNLAPGRPRGDGPPDLVLLLPSSREVRDDAWVREAAALAASMGPDGLVFLLGAPPRSLLRALASQGLEPAARLLHVPDRRRSRYVVTLEPPIGYEAIRRVIPLSSTQRLAVRALLRVGWKRWPFSVSTVMRRTGGDQPLRWLAESNPGAGGGPAAITRSWRADGATVAQLLNPDGGSQVVAKVGGGAAREAVGLAEVAAGARTPSVTVPRLLESRTVGDHAAAIATGVAGIPAANELSGKPRRAGDLLASIADWLAAWNAHTAAPGAFEQADADRHLLDPARRLASSLAGGAAYVQRLQRQCDSCLGQRVPFVAAHNDLTAANILLSPDGGLGVLDWEESEARALPLGDIVYAVADLAAATEGYRDREAAFRKCFGNGGAFAEASRAPIRGSAEQLNISAPMAELCFHACWLMHADNERRRGPGGAPDERPFLRILQTVAAGKAAVGFGP